MRHNLTLHCVGVFWFVECQKILKYGLRSRGSMITPSQSVQVGTKGFLISGTVCERLC